MEFPYSEENYGTIVNIADPRPAGGDPGSSAADPHAPDLEAGAACALRLFMPVAAEHRGPLHRDPVPHQFGHHSDRRGGGTAGDRRSGPADHFLRSLPYNRPAVKHSQIFRPGDGTTDFGASHGFRGSVNSQGLSHLCETAPGVFEELDQAGVMPEKKFTISCR